MGGSVERGDPSARSVAPGAGAPGLHLAGRAALDALGRTGRRARVTYNSTTQAGCFAVVLAGLAITVSTPSHLPPGLVWVGEGDGLPPLPEMGILLSCSDSVLGMPRLPAGVAALSGAIRQGFGSVGRRMPMDA